MKGIFFTTDLEYDSKMNKDIIRNWLQGTNFKKRMKELNDLKVSDLQILIEQSKEQERQRIAKEVEKIIDDIYHEGQENLEGKELSKWVFTFEELKQKLGLTK